MSDDHEPLKLSFGYNPGLPTGTRAAWGARLIVTQDGFTDFLYDRQSAAGDDTLVQKTLAWLNSNSATLENGKNANPVTKAREVASGLLRNGHMHTRKEEEFTLYSDAQGTIVGNTNGSAGYLYIAAYLFESMGEVIDGG